MGATAPHIGDIPRCGEPEITSRTRAFLESRCGELEVQEKSSVNVEMELTQDDNYSVALTLADFAKHLKFIPVSPTLRSARKNRPREMKPSSASVRSASCVGWLR